MEYTIKADELQKVLDYLVLQPYREVYLLVEVVKNLPQVEKGKK